MRRAGRPVAASAGPGLPGAPRVQGPEGDARKDGQHCRHVMIAARSDRDTKRADEIIDAGTGRAWAEAPSFWRSTGYSKLNELAETGKDGGMDEKDGSRCPFVPIPANRAERATLAGASCLNSLPTPLGQLRARTRSVSTTCRTTASQIKLACD